MVGASQIPASHAFCAPAPSPGGKPFASSARTRGMGTPAGLSPPKETDVLAERATARNRAILWVTGMRASEVCALRLVDVDREQGMLRVRGKGSQQRRLTLGHEGLRHLLAYLDKYRLGAAECVERTDT